MGPELVLLDSSGYLALINPHDAHHPEARTVWTRLTEQQWRTCTTNFIIAETHALFLVRLGRIHATAFLRQFATSTTTIIRATTADEERAQTIVFQHDDKDYSLTDAITFAVMERLQIRSALAFDHHFAQYGLEVLR